MESLSFFQLWCMFFQTKMVHHGPMVKAATAGHVPGHVVPGHVVSEVMPPELAGRQPGAVPHGHPSHPSHPSHPHPMHPVHPPCGPGPSYAAPGSFLLCIESAKDLYDVDTLL